MNPVAPTPPRWSRITSPLPRERRSRIRLYHQWLPNVVLDYHEMNTDRSYFFQPGVPERTHPLIPEVGQGLTERLSGYLAEADG